MQISKEEACVSASKGLGVLATCLQHVVLDLVQGSKMSVLLRLEGPVHILLVFLH